jgi:hypothetical protein
MSQRFRIGWDVGAWHCDNNRASQDALVVLEFDGHSPRRIGSPWRGNVRSILSENTGIQLIHSFLRLCGVDANDRFDAVIGIDTPLGWPQAAIALLNGEDQVTVGPQEAHNPYTRRRTEAEIIEGNYLHPNGQRLRPLSVVRDQIGSQSTKGLHFLRAANLQSIGPGIWHSAADRNHVIAIETYPALATATANERFHQIESELRDPNAHEDHRDALKCAIVSHLFGDLRDEIEGIPDSVPVAEGWIVRPRRTTAA